MKRVTQPPRRKKKRYTPIITIIAAMVFNRNCINMCVYYKT